MSVCFTALGFEVKDLNASSIRSDKTSWVCAKNLSLPRFLDTEADQMRSLVYYTGILFMAAYSVLNCIFWCSYISSSVKTKPLK